MAPSNSKHALEKKPKSSTPRPSLKQGLLSFTAAKSGASAAKGKKNTPVKGEVSIIPEAISSSDKSSEDDDIVFNLSPKKRAKRETENTKEVEPEIPRADLDVLEKAGRFRKHYGVVREIMGSIPPVHAEGQTKVHHILRVFDTSYEYGPCVGVTRLERWERAHAIGLNPPPEVREILLTKQGANDDSLKQTVFYGEV